MVHLAGRCVPAWAGAAPHESCLCHLSMTRQFVEFVRDKRFVRRARELATIRVMLRMYCRSQGHEKGGPLCAACGELLQYATRRLERCVFGDAKPTCANCLVHCYSADMRDRVKILMRYAGPRMLLRHPILGISHMLDGRRPVPKLPGRRAKKPSEG